MDTSNYLQRSGLTDSLREFKLIVKRDEIMIILGKTDGHIHDAF